jgi:hypothetical protein
MKKTKSGKTPKATVALRTDPGMVFADCCGIKALLAYVSMFSARIRGDQAALKPQADRVYRFKKTGRHADTFRRMIDAARAELNCSAVWIVPPSTVGEVSQLQLLYPGTIKRLRTVIKRKYHHADAVVVLSMEYPQAEPGTRVLLVDDVTTTGLTLTEIKTHLEGRGVIAERLALGMFWRIFHGKFPAEQLETQWKRFFEMDKWRIEETKETDWST